jgi:hypothetical protein
MFDSATGRALMATGGSRGQAWHCPHLRPRVLVRVRRRRVRRRLRWRPLLRYPRGGVRLVNYRLRPVGQGGGHVAYPSSIALYVRASLGATARVKNSTLTGVALTVITSSLVANGCSAPPGWRVAPRGSLHVPRCAVKPVADTSPWPNIHRRRMTLGCFNARLGAGVARPGLPAFIGELCVHIDRSRAVQAPIGEERPVAQRSFGTASSTVPARVSHSRAR